MANAEAGFGYRSSGPRNGRAYRYFLQLVIYHFIFHHKIAKNLTSSCNKVLLPLVLIMAFIPTQQQGAVVQDPGENFKIQLQHDIPVGNPGPDEILVKLTCTGLW